MEPTYDNSSVYKKLNLTSQEVLLLKSLEEFYNNTQYFDLLLSIIEGTSIISRRTFEYFVTKYAMIHNISYELEENGTHVSRKCIFIVHSSYKDQLKAHKKKYFDPFGRGDRIPFFSNNDCIITTIGQLNFYRWFFTKKIYDYCILNYTNIQNELLSNKNVKKRSRYNASKKRSTSCKKQMNYIKVEYNPNNDKDIIVSFDF
jgi:hypothetical protein